jgi:hypothetical protein
MSFKAGEIKIGDTSKTTSGVSPNIHLDKKELEVLLLTLKNSTFQGSQVELLYNLVLKLQNCLLDRNK